MIRWVVLGVGLLAGCSHSPPTGWERIGRIEVCTSIDSPGEPREFPIRLDPRVRSELMSLLQYQNIEEPQCWFGHADGTVLLRSGNVCVSMKEASFARQNAVGASPGIKSIRRVRSSVR